MVGAWAECQGFGGLQQRLKSLLQVIRSVWTRRPEEVVLARRRALAPTTCADPTAARECKVPDFAHRQRRWTPGALGEFMELGWCNYMNGLTDPAIYFVSGGKWVREYSTTHGYKAMYYPSDLPIEKREMRPVADYERRGLKVPFHWPQLMTTGICPGRSKQIQQTTESRLAKSNSRRWGNVKWPT